MSYDEAAQLAKSVDEGGGLKKLLYNSDIPSKNLRGVAFLATNALQQKKTIDGILTGTHLKYKLKDDLEWWIARVLVVEICLGRKSFRAVKPVEKLVYRYKQEIRNLSASVTWSKATETPRYVRVNTLVTSLNQVEAQLRDRGFTRVKFHYTKLTARRYLSFLQKVDNLEPHEYILDVHVPNLLIFNRKALLADWDLVDNGTLLLQDKSSCFVAPLVAPHPGSVTLDMCAAPGFKTQHLATFLHGLGRIIAVDKCEERYKALSELTDKFELKNVKCLNKDALDCLEPEDRVNIDYILLDPPCSGSGVVSNFDFNAMERRDSQRLQLLHNVQCALLRTALTKYPNVRRVVYSTCSMNEEENEQVIEEFAQPPCGFELVDLSKYYKEVTCGLENYSTGRYCIRLSPHIERTNGFFIAMFERLNPAERAQKSISSESELEMPTKRRRITLEEYPSAGDVPKEAVVSSSSSEDSEDEKSEDPPKVEIKKEKPETELLRTIIKHEKKDIGYETGASDGGNQSTPAVPAQCAPLVGSCKVDEYEKENEDPPILSVSVGVRETSSPSCPPPLMSVPTTSIIPDTVTDEAIPPEPEWPEEQRGDFLGDRYHQTVNHQRFWFPNSNSFHAYENREYGGARPMVERGQGRGRGRSVYQWHRGRGQGRGASNRNETKRSNSSNGQMNKGNSVQRHVAQGNNMKLTNRERKDLKKLQNKKKALVRMRKEIQINKQQSN